MCTSTCLLNRVFNANIELQNEFLRDVSKCGKNDIAKLYCYSIKNMYGEEFEEGKKELVAWCLLETPEVRNDKTGEVLEPRLFRCFSVVGTPLFDSLEGVVLSLDEIWERVYCNPDISIWRR